MTTEFKIVFAGSMGAGKTTAIRAISDFDPISTDVVNTDTAQHAKLTTTVGLDYGECRLGDDAVLRLYGTPGQERFGYMWEILGEGAFGLIVLSDNTRPNPLADLDTYLDTFVNLVPERRIVIGVGRTETSQQPTVRDYSNHLNARGLNVPVLAVDVRKPDDVRLLLNILVHMVEIDHA